MVLLPLVAGAVVHPACRGGSRPRGHELNQGRATTNRAICTVTNLYGVSSNLWWTSSGPTPGYLGWSDGNVTVPDALGDVQARLPNGVLFAGNGTIYVTEDYYHLIRQVTGTDLPLVPPPPPTPPGAPTILTVIVLTNNAQIILTWSSVGSSNITYNVKRSTTSGGPYTLLANTSSTNYTDSGVGSGTYYYVVSAIGAGGESPNSAEVSATMPQTPVPAPLIGYVDFPATSLPVAYTSVFHPVSSFVANNDVIIAATTNTGTETFVTASPAPGVTPSPVTGHQYNYPGDGTPPGQVPTLATACNGSNGNITIEAIGVASGRPNSAVVSAQFQFITANPVITGNNAAQFAVSDITTNAEMWYTIDGITDPTNAAPSLGPISSGASLSLNASSGLTLKIRAFRTCYQPSAIVTNVFSPASFVPNTISFGFASGEASSDFIASPGQVFYAPVTLSPVSGTEI